VTSHRSLDIARLRVVGIAGQVRVGNDRLRAARKNGDAVPRFLSAPDSAVACLLDRGSGEFAIRGLQLLQAHHVGFGSAQPAKQIGEPLVDIVDVKGGDFHFSTAPAGARFPE
jgi:hypothetical protein